MNNFLQTLTRVLGSYWLSVSILFCMFLLTYFGTLQQVEDGLYVVQQEYFYSLFVIQDPIPLFPLPAFVKLPFPLPLPGGFTLMGLLSLNLFVGGLIRIRKNSRTVGIIVTHVGMAFLMTAGLVKVLDSEDGYVALAEGESSGWFQSHFLWDLVVFEAQAPDGENPEGALREWIIPQELFLDLDNTPRRFTAPDLPFELELAHYMRHSQVLPQGPMWTSPAPGVAGYALRPLPNQQEAETHLPALWARVSNGVEPQELLLWGGARFPQVVTTGAQDGDTVASGERFGLGLRKRRFEFPWEIRLEDFHMEEHPGTQMASEYRSDVTQIEGDLEQEVRIEMNKPMRRDGYILYQASYGRRSTDGRLYSQFAVVRNPSDQWPKYACYVIGIGMLIAFGQRLTKYIQSQNAQRAKAAS